MERLTTVFVTLTLLIWTSFPCSAAAEEPSVGNMPPVVVGTAPVAGALDVDPSLSEIKVTFSKQMADKSWSWVQMSPQSFPQLIGDPQYLSDKKTCVSKVKLKPNTTYVIWFNSERYNYFKDTAGRSAVPYLLVFKTKG